MDTQYQKVNLKNLQNVSNMDFKNILEKSIGIITYDDFSTLDISLGITGNIDNLKEDLLQIEYPNSNLILDLGWYPSFDEKGTFSLSIIKDFDWEKPIKIEKCKSFNSLSNLITKFIDYCNNY